MTCKLASDQDSNSLRSYTVHIAATRLSDLSSGMRRSDNKTPERLHVSAPCQGCLLAESTREEVTTACCRLTPDSESPYHRNRQLTILLPEHGRRHSCSIRTQFISSRPRCGADSSGFQTCSRPRTLCFGSTPGVFTQLRTVADALAARAAFRFKCWRESMVLQAAHLTVTSICAVAHLGSR